MRKTQSMSHMRVRLEPSILINDEITFKRFIYRIILRIFEEFGVSVSVTAGQSAASLEIDTLFGIDGVRHAKEQAIILLESHIARRSSGEPASVPETVPSFSNNLRSNSRSNSSGGNADFLASFNLIGRKANDPRLHEHVWFLIFIRAEP